ncbi:anti-sigma B factor RsbW [Paenibacillus glycanilyticus]|uniref:Serine-protein kinase RsbW n=1 Tax=Paenibacillus glycanilyticus TaxID=126569 RepID=A0ABQ6G696_9BACL|nr:anti-sigma B factor RsbW [Paenibacillus glycanilyticus]GLX66493.1 serine-protein kinase RsbW [Paenibacillus glycanilyticus]
MKPWISLTIPAQADYIDIVRLTLSGLAAKEGFSYEEIEDMKVAVTEACSNVVLHAYDGGTYGLIEVVFEIQQDSLHIRVKDSGNSFQFEPTAIAGAALHNKPLNEASIGGLGLFLMQALMDQVEVRSEMGTEVILTKRLGRKEEMA